MKKYKILVVDDEEDIIELVKYNLEKEGHEVIGATTGEEGLSLAREAQPDLLVLDLMLPGLGGLDICRLIKGDPLTARISVVMLTAKGDEADIVNGLELGADDYIVKPFSPKVLVARVNTVLRRSHYDSSPASQIQVDSLFIDLDRHELKLDGEKLELTNTEFKIMHLLASHVGVVFTRSQIVDKVRGEDYPVTDRSIDVQMVNLRKKLGGFGGEVETVRSVGYRFKDSEK